MLITRIKFIVLLIAVLCGVNSFTAEPADEAFLVYNRLERDHFKSDTTVRLSICIKNISSTSASFKIYSGGPEIGDYLTFQPVVFDNQGNEAETIVPYKMKNQNLMEVSKTLKERAILLDPGEVFTHSISLNTIYKLENDVPYRVRSFFFPDLLAQQVVLKSNNEVSLVVSDRGLGTVKTGIIRERPEIELDRTMAPSEVVIIHLLGEKNREMNKFIKYIDIKKYINSYSDYIRLYQLADDDEKRTIEDDFISYLSRERSDYILDFKITQEEVENNKKISYVDVVVDRFNPRRTKRFRYRYTLEKENDHWLITGLEATIMKGIAR